LSVLVVSRVLDAAAVKIALNFPKRDVENHSRK
jgi:hypothetical protein